MCKALKLGSTMMVGVLLFNLFTTFSFCKERLYGDLNNDGDVNAIDFALLRGELLQTKPLYGNDWEKYADLNQDNSVSAIDFAVLRLYLLGMIDTLPYIPGPGTPEPTPTVDPQSDWVPYIPKSDEVKLSLVIKQMSGTYIQVDLKLGDGVYRIKDGNLLVPQLEPVPESVPGPRVNRVFYTSGVTIEKYVGSEKLTSSNMQINYTLNGTLGNINHFIFNVNDTLVKDIYFSQNSIIDNMPILYGSRLNENFVNGNTEFALNLMKRINNDATNSNMFFSPISVSMALSMLYQGAGTSTKECMAETLNYTGMSDNEINQSYADHMSYFKDLSPSVELNLSNSIWIDDDFKVKDSFKSINTEIFNAECFNLNLQDPSACDSMNDWISDSTKGLIGKMMYPPLPENIKMILINAIYFKGSWASKFDKSNTKDADFTTINGDKKTIPMMNKTDSCLYTDNSEYKAVKLPYGKENISMSLILPHNDNINDFISKFDSEKLAQMNNYFSERNKVILSIPRFKIGYEPDGFNAILEAEGLGEAFSDAADFSGISESRLKIGDVRHRAVIDVDEEGTEAAAVTIIAMASPGVATTPPPTPTFIADKPFMFVIQDNLTGTILFMGKVADFKNN